MPDQTRHGIPTSTVDDAPTEGAEFTRVEDAFTSMVDGPVLAPPMNGLDEDLTDAEAQEAAPPPSLGRKFFNVRTFISFAFGFAILLFLFTRVQIDVGAILDRVRQANPLLLVLALVVYYCTFPVRALRWGQLLRNTERHLPPARRMALPSVAGLAEIIFLSWFANCVVPAKLGDAYRAYLLKQVGRISFSRTFGTILAERIIDVLVLFFLMVAAASLAFGQALPPQVVALMQLGGVLAGLVIVMLVLMRRLRPLVLKLLPARFHLQYAHFEHGTLESFNALPLVVTLTLASWTAEVLRLYLVTAALGLGGIAPSVLVFVALASALATTLPLTPAGLGFAEGTIVGVFLLAASAGLAPGVDEHAAASIALLDRTISYWSLVVFGLVGYIFSKRT